MVESDLNVMAMAILDGDYTVQVSQGLQLKRFWGLVQPPTPPYPSCRRVHPPTVHTSLLSSPVGLDLKLAKRPGRTP